MYQGWNDADDLARQLTGLLCAALVIAGAVVCGLLLVLQPTLAAAAILATVLGLIVLISPDTATVIVTFVLYSNLAVVAVRFHGAPRIILTVFPLLIVVPFVSYVVFRRQKLIVSRVSLFVLLFLVVQILGMVFSRDPATSAEAVLELATEGAALFFLITNVVRTRKMLRRVTWTLLLAGGLMGAAPLCQQVTRTFDNDYGGLAQTTDVGFRTGKASGSKVETKSTVRGEFRQVRSRGTLGEQNRHAQNMLMLLPLGLFLVFSEKSPSLRLLALLTTALTAIGFILTFSRGGNLAVLAALVIASFMRLVKPRHLLFAGVAVVVILLALPQYWTRFSTVASIPGLFSRYVSRTESPDGSFKGRAAEMVAATLVFADRPLIGVGPKMFKSYSQKYGNPLGIQKLEGGMQAHSLFPGIAAENGILGLFCFCAMLFLTLRGLVRVRRRWTSECPELANMATAYLFALILYILTGTFLHTAYIRFFFLILALSGVVTYVASLQETDEGEAEGSLVPVQGTSR